MAGPRTSLKHALRGSTRTRIIAPKFWKPGDGRVRGQGLGQIARTAGRRALLGKPLQANPFQTSAFHGRGAPRQLDWASDEAREAFNYGPAPLMLSGGFGAAKTATLCIKAMYLSSRYPKNRGIIARKQGEKLRKTTMTTFFKWCPPEAYMYGRRSDHEKSLILNNGSEILWAHLDDSEIVELLRGLEINWFIIDQAEEVSEEIVDVLMRRLGRWDQAEVPQELIDQEEAAGRAWPWRNEQTGKPIPPTYPMFTCNPDHELHWIYRRFHAESPEWQEKYRHQGYRMIHMDARKNKFLPKQNLELMMQGTQEFVDRFVIGKWGIPAGSIHQISPKSLLRWTPELQKHLDRCIKGRSMDHGESSPTCVLWWAADAWGNLFCYLEYYQPAELISFHRERIYALSIVVRNGEAQLDDYTRDLADPMIFAARPAKGGMLWSVAEEYRSVLPSGADEHTQVFWQKADNDELGTRNRINEYLKEDALHAHPITGEKGAPRIYFVQRSADYPHGCYEVIRQTRSQKRVKVGTKDGQDVFSDERDETIEDHAYDPLRYYVADCPGLAGEEARKVSPKSWMAAQEQLRRMEMDKMSKRCGSNRRLDLARARRSGFGRGSL